MKKQSKANIKVSGVESSYKTGLIICSIKTSVQHSALAKMECPAKVWMTNKDIDGAILLYGMFRKIYSKLCHPSARAAKTKCHDVSCNISGGYFNIRAKTESNKTAMRKVAGLIVKNMNLSGLGMYYRGQCKLLGLQADNDALVFHSAAIMSELNKQIDVFISAKIKSGVLSDDFAEVIAKKYTKRDVPRGGKNRTISHIEPVPDVRESMQFPSVAQAIATYDALSTEFGGFAIFSKYIYYYPDMEKYVQSAKKKKSSKKYDQDTAIDTALLHGHFSASDAATACGAGNVSAKI